MDRSEINPNQFLSIPLFPLGTTLFPGGILPLKIFEVRYLDMVKACFRDHKPFCIVTIAQGNEVRKPNEVVTFSQVGTLASIEQFEAVQPSLFVIQCLGKLRFKIISSELHKNGLWEAQIQTLEDDVHIPVPDELQSASQSLKKVIESLADQGLTKEQMPFSKPFALNDCGWVANRWSELLPLPPGQKEHLLGLDNPRLRLDLVSELLQEMGIMQDE